MTKTTENLDSTNEEYSEIDLSGLEGDALNEKVKELDGKYKKVLDTNRQLFARAKKAEGFEQNETGDWVKTAKPVKPEAKKSEKSDNMLLERYDNVAKKLAGLVEADEVEFFEKWRSENGYENTDIDTVLDKKGFKTELTDFRASKVNLKATSDIKGTGDGSGGAKGNPDYWIAKATKGDDGKLRFPDETPKELYSKILDKLSSDEPNSSGTLKFYNEK